VKVVVISDTHIPKKANTLPARLQIDLKKADLIIHAGDWQTLDVLEELSNYAEVKGVYGNVDGKEIQEHLPEKLIININDKIIGIVHGHGKRLTTEKRALEAFKDIKVDCIIFGHSHIPVIKEVDGILLFNPGSSTDKRRQQQYSYGILTVNQSIHAELVYFDDKS
jgi:putative phosphoesterase